MAPMLFCIIFSAMLQDASRNCSSCVMITFRSDSGIFDLRLKAQTKVSLLLLRELLFEDDCALIVHTEDELQSILNDFARAASRYGFTISIKKTEVMFRPKPSSSPCDPVIKISDKQVKVVLKFCYLGRFLSQNVCIDEELAKQVPSQMPEKNLWHLLEGQNTKHYFT